MVRVQVVDDDETIAEFVDWVLTDEGYAVTVAPNGAVALEMVDALPPAVILLDMRMPVMDGWEFARHYRENCPSPAPIIVITAAKDADGRARQIEADDFLGKPFDVADLIAKVRRFAPLPLSHEEHNEAP